MAITKGMGPYDDEETGSISERQERRKRLAQSPQDGRAPTRLFYNNPYPGGKPDVFIKTKDRIDESKKIFKINTGIDLAKRKRKNKRA
tara:strand:- start:39 stop:302 length:264 start_codon:yes stop_codon:yes gene_type:complete